MKKKAKKVVVSRTSSRSDAAHRRSARASVGKSHPAVGARAKEFEPLRLAYIALLDAACLAEELKQPAHMRYYDVRAEACRKELIRVGVL